MRLWSYTPARVANDVVHVLSAGVWPGAVAAIWVLRSGARSALPPETLALVTRSWYGIYGVMVVSLAILVATGAGRLQYRGMSCRPAMLASRTRTALIEHAVFATVFVLATAASFVLLYL